MARPLILPSVFSTTDFSMLVKKYGLRRHGIRLLALKYVQEHHSIKKSSDITGITSNTIRLWIKLFADKGLEGLLAPPTGQGRISLLTEQDEDKLRSILDQRAKNLTGGRLRGQDVQAIIKQEFGVSYKQSAVYTILHRIGCSWVTSRSQHPQSDPALQESFKK